MSDSKPNFAILNNENYANWKFKMELLLRKNNLWKQVIEGSRPEPKRNQGNEVVNQSELDAWDMKDDEARGTIGLLVMDDQLGHIRSAKTAKATWSALKDYHEKNTLTNKVYLMRSICSLKLQEGGNAISHINAMNDLFTKLRDVGEEGLSDKWSAAMLLSSLPEGYDALITSLESRKEEEITFALVQQRVIAEFERKQHSVNEGNDSILKVVAGTNGVCYFCKKSGHQKKNCTKYKYWKTKQNSGKNPNKINSIKEKVNEENKSEDFLFKIGNTKKFCWLVDSGATRHTVNERKFFKNLNHNYKSSIELANGQTIAIEGIGEGEIITNDEFGNQHKITLREVLYAPCLVGNILSVRQLTKSGYNVAFKDNNCCINSGNNNIGIADIDGEMYILRQPDFVHAVLQHNENCIHQWHRRLGHRDPEAIRKMCNEKLVEGLNIVGCGIKEICESCVKGKMTRLSFPRQSMTKSTAPLELIHSDVCGPMQTTTPSGKRFIVTFIDDFSRFTVIRLISQKSEVLQTFKDFVMLCRTKFGKIPKKIRSDRGGEYTGKAFEDYLKCEGIENQLTAPYSPQQNGKAERKNRTLIEMARCMLSEADLPYTFWGEAVATANFIQNRVLTRTTNATPYELWYGIKPSVDKFHVFGSKCFVHIPTEKRRKLDSKATEMIFLGYDEKSKAFRCYDQYAKKVVISRDVIFTDFIKIDAENVSISLNPRIKELLIEEEIPENNSVKENTINIPIEGRNNLPDENNIEENSINIPNEESTNSTQDSNICEQHIRTSKRCNKGSAPKRLIEEIWSANEIREPKSYHDAINSTERAQWLEAMQDELESLQANQTWELVSLPEGRTAIGSKWVYKVKRDVDGQVNRFKARLVAQGFSQKFGVDYDEVFAPVATHTSFRILLSIAGKEKMMVNHFDVKTAFLNGKLSETIFMQQPPGFQDNNEQVCLLKKSIYGLKQAARSWNMVLHEALEKMGFKQCINDLCFYYGNISGKLSYILVYVDDIIVACNTSTQMNYIGNTLSKNFTIVNLGKIKHYLGIEITQDYKGNFQLFQSSYIGKVVNEYGMQDSKNVKTPMDVSYGKSEDSTLLETNMKYRKLIGQLLYISVNSRPDISAAVNILAQKVANPTMEDWSQCKRVLKYLKSTSQLKLNLSNDENEQSLVGYADANWAEERTERKSNSGRIYFYNGGTIGWSCQKQSIVATSTCEAEFISLSEASKDAKWLRQLLEEIHYPINEPTLIYNDNQSCLRLVNDDKFSFRTKHIDTKYKLTKDLVKKGIIRCTYCPTEEMIADILTKPLTAPKHVTLREKCNLK